MSITAGKACRNPKETSSKQHQIKKTCKSNPPLNFSAKNSATGVQGKSPIGIIRASHLQQVLTALTNWSAKFETKSWAVKNNSGTQAGDELKVENVTEESKCPLSSSDPKASKSDICLVPDKNDALPENSADHNLVRRKSDQATGFFVVKPENRQSKAEKYFESCTRNVQPSDFASELTEEKRKGSHEAPKKMSLLEQKRLQWAAERAQIREWDPWGRPGGGAPLTISGSESLHTAVPESKDWAKANNCNYRIITSPLHVSVSDEFNQQNGRLPPLPQNSISPNTNTFVRPTPAAMASSLTFGLSSSNNNYDSWKEEAKKHWLNDLEKQREEQRLKRLEEKGFYQKMVLSNNMNTQSSINNLGLNGIVTSEAIPTSDRECGPLLPTLNRMDRTPSMSPTLNNMNLGVNAGNDASAGSQRTFLRGANIPLDSKTQLELETKRKSALEQQKAIKHQLEERLRFKQQERERHKREEIEEEMRLAKERERLDEQFKFDAQQKAMKEDILNQQREAVVEAISIARHSAQVTKNRKYATPLPDVLDGTGSENIVAEKEVLQASTNGTSLKSMLEVPTQNSVPYIFNRVLTPTKYRDGNLHTRDCATQTDFPTTGHIPYKKDMATITKNTSKGQDSDATSTGSSPPNGQKNAKSKSKSSRKKVNKQASRKERPQWGVNQAPQKKQPVQQQKPPKAAPHTTSSETAKTEVTRAKTESRHFSGSKTRSSAEHQRKIIAQEGAMAVISQRNCLSPYSAARPTATDSSTTGDEVANVNQPARRRRRQWESPGRDEMPNFYTNSPLLPDVRHVRRISVSGSGNGNFNGSPPKVEPSVPQTSVSIRTPQSPLPFRSDSPPVPALRHKLNNAAMGVQPASPSCAESETEVPKPPTSTRSPAKSQLAEPLNKCSDIVPPVNSHSFDSLELSAADVPLKSGNLHAGLQCASSIDPNDNHRSSTPSFLQNERDLSSSWSLNTPSLVYQRADILKKLTLIRQGLLLRQQELDSILASRENSRNELQEAKKSTKGS